MTVRDVLECGLITDKTPIRIRTEFIGTVQQIAKGVWYEDHILNHQDAKVFEFKWSKIHGATIVIDREQS